MTTTTHSDDRRRRRVDTRDLPKPEFTDAEAGAKEFPDSTARRYNYFIPQKRKQTHYEDVTVEVQPDPRHYLSQGWLYGFSDGRGGYPLDWTALKAWGSDRPEPERFPGSGGRGYDWPAHGWHEFRDPNEEWELTLYRYNANVVRQINANIDTARETKAFEQWNPNWVQLRGAQHRRLDARRARPRALPVRQRQPAGADEHAQQRDLGEQHAPDPVRSGPGAVQPDAQRGDRGLRRRGAHRDLEQRPGLAGRPQGRRAAHRDRRLVRGDLRRERRLRAARRRAVPQPPRAAGGAAATATSSRRRSSAPASTTTPQRDLRYTMAMFELLTNDKRVRRPQQGDHGRVAVRLGAARASLPPATLQPLWSQPDAKPPRFEDGLDRAKSRFSGILSDLGLRRTEGADAVTTVSRRRPRARSSPTTPRPTCAASP